jgi:DNA-binding FadR family transcriptional regulator
MMVFFETHYLIVDAVERRDPAAVRQGMTVYLPDVEAAILWKGQK